MLGRLHPLASRWTGRRVHDVSRELVVPRLQLRVPLRSEERRIAPSSAYCVFRGPRGVSRPLTRTGRGEGGGQTLASPPRKGGSRSRASFSRTLAPPPPRRGYAIGESIPAVTALRRTCKGEGGARSQGINQSNRLSERSRYCLAPHPQRRGRGKVARYKSV